MSRHFWRLLISLLVIAGLIVPSSLWSAPPVSAVPSHTPLPQTRMLGHIIFAPAIDADGDPATNPIESAPVPIAQLIDQQSGLVALAAQLQPLDTHERLLGTLVTWRVWRGDQVVVDQAYQADEWGVVVVKVPLADIHGEYRYQASAPGYSETPMRSFRFDPAQVALHLRGDGAELNYQPTSAGRVLLTLTTSVDLDATRDEASVVLARQPQVLPAEAQAKLSTTATNQTEVWLPFPAVRMDIVDAHTAQIELQLPPGNYHAVGSMSINALAAQHLIAPTRGFAIDQAAPLPEAANAVWVATHEHEQGQRLVRYDAPAGQAIFALVEAAQAPTLEADWDTGTTRLQAWRVGAFEWAQEIYRVEYQPQHDVEATLHTIGYDPIARRYTIALRAPITTTATVRVEVLGANETVLQQETYAVDLAAQHAVARTVDAPADVGQPYGLRVSMIDLTSGVAQILFTARLIDQRRVTRLAPEAVLADDGQAAWITSLRASAAKTQPAEAAEEENKDKPGFGLVQTVQLKFSVSVLEVEVATLAYTYKPGEWEGGLISWGVIMLELARHLSGSIFSDGKVALLSGGANFAYDVGFNYTAVDPGNCDDPTWKDKTAARFKILADEIDSHLTGWGEDPEEVGTPAIPLIGWLSMWVDGTFDARFKADSDDLKISFTTRLELEVVINIGFSVPVDLVGKFEKLAKFTRGIILAVDIVTTLVSLFNGPEDLNLCDVDSLTLPDSLPPDDRQDVWQDADTLYHGATLDQTISNLHDLIAHSRAQGLTRAETYLTLRLRQAEIQRFSAQPDGYLNYLSSVEHIAQAANLDVQGILSGTIPITPGVTITDAIMARNEPAIQAIAKHPFAVQLRTLQDNALLARRDYHLLYGQELELQQELRQLFSQNVIGIVASGFPLGTLSALRAAGLPGQLVSPWPGQQHYRGLPAPYVAPDFAPRVLIVPAGGLHQVAESIEAQAWLSDYVAGGGQLIVFTQAFGTDWSVLPGGQIRGVGYVEDQRCQKASVRAVSPSPWLAWMGVPRPDIQVDGIFLNWPSTATILLKRTTGEFANYPAMIEYPFGQGHVLATTAYGDWAVQTGLWWGDDWQMTRTILTRAYLQMQGQDVDTVPIVNPNDLITLAWPVTNTTSFSITSASARLNMLGTAGRVTVQTSYAPGEGHPLTVTLRAPATSRNVHSWTQAGLFRATATLTGTQPFETWGPIVYVPGPIDNRQVAVSLAAGDSVAPALRPVIITTTIVNSLPTSRTVVLRGLQNYPTAPVTYTLDAQSQTQVTRTASLVGLGSTAVRVGLFNTAGTQLDAGALALFLRFPGFQANTTLPPILTNGVSITSFVKSVPSIWSQGYDSIASTNLVTLTASNQSTVWAASRAVPPLVLGQVDAATDVLANIEPARLGTYTLTQDIMVGSQLMARSQWNVPARVTIDGQFDRRTARARETVNFTATINNTGRFNLSPVVTVSIPLLNVTQVQSISLPVSQTVAVPAALTLPLTTTSRVYAVVVSVGQGTVVSQTYSINVPPSSIAASISGGAYQSGDVIPASLSNTGGVDTTASYTFYLLDSNGRFVATSSATVTIPAGGQTPIGFATPNGTWSGNYPYRLRLNAIDQATQQNVTALRALTLAGLGAELDAHTDQPSYIAGATINVTGAITPVNNTLSDTLDGTLQLAVEADAPAQISDLNTSIANSHDELGYFNHQQPDLAVDAAGNAYAVWSDDRFASTPHRIYFAYRPANGAWGPNEAVASNVYSATLRPRLAIDGSGNAYVIWGDAHVTPGVNVLYFTRRAANDTWSSIERVDDVSTGISSASLAVDAAGNAYAAWIEAPSSSPRFSYRPAAGAWGASEVINASLTVNNHPDIALDASGNAYVAWEVEQTMGKPDIFFAIRSSGGWSAPQRLNDDVAPARHTYPSVAVDPIGNAAATWIDERSGIHVYASYRSITTTTWITNEKVSTTAGATLADVVLDANDTLHVAYTITDTLYAARPLTGTWSAPQRVNDVTTGVRRTPSLALDANGNRYSLWEDSRNAITAANERDIYFSMRAVTATGWISNVVVNEGGGAMQSMSSMAVDASGNSYVAFRDERRNNFDIYFNTRTITGTWGRNVPVADMTLQSQDMPALAVSPTGTAYIVWQDNRTGNSDIRFSMGRPGAWITSTRVNDDAGTTGQSNPSIALDQDNNAYVAWIDDRNALTPPYSRVAVYFSRRSAISGTWSLNEKVTDVLTTTTIWMPKVKVDAVGNAYAMWGDLRTGIQHLYFAYRPVNGAWSANEQIDDGGVAVKARDFAVTPDGTAYAVWIDNRLGVDQLYYAVRPAGGSWSISQRVDPLSTQTPSNVALALDPDGTLYAAWDEYPFTHYIAAKPVNGTWSARVNQPVWCLVLPPSLPDDGLFHCAGVVLDAGYNNIQDVSYNTFRASFAGDRVLWSQQQAISTATVLPITATVGTLGGRPGKYWLTADLSNALSQTMASTRQPFYVFDANLAVTLTPDRAAYRSGQPITVTGRVTNTGASTVNVDFTLAANDQIVLAQSYPLSAGQSTTYAQTITATGDVMLRATANGISATQVVKVSAPQANVSLDAPTAVVAGAPFNATVSVANPNPYDIAVQVTLGNTSPENVALTPGQTSLVQRTLSVTTTTALPVAVRGHVTLDLTRTIQTGISATLRLIAPPNRLGGPIGLSYVITTTSGLPSDANLVINVDNGVAYSGTLTLMAGRVLSGGTIMTVPAGFHQITGTLQGIGQSNISSSSFGQVFTDMQQDLNPRVQVTAITLTPTAVTAGSVFTINAQLLNTGSASPVIAGVQSFTVAQQKIITPTAFTTSTLVFTQSVPADMSSGEYIGQISFNEQYTPFIVTVSGASVQLGLQLDRPTHAEGELITLTATLTETAGQTRDYHLAFGMLNAEDFVTVTLGAHQTLTHAFVFTATQTDRAAVALSAAAAPGEMMERTIMIDSVPVVVTPADAPFALSFDRAVYYAGDTVTMTLTTRQAMSNLDVFGPQELWIKADHVLFWTAPELHGQVLSGTYVLTYTLPQTIRSGQYTFMARTGDAWPFTIDVRGTEVLARRITLDQARYDGHAQIAATAEFINNGAAINNVVLSAHIAQPDGTINGLATPFTRTITLQPGLNAFNVTGVLSTSQSGPQRLIVDVRYPGEIWRIAGAAAQFDVGGVHLIELTTDHGSYALNQPSEGRLDLYGLGAAQVVVTATNGATLLNVSPQLTGFKTYTFALPTDAYGDYQLTATGTDEAGQIDRVTHAYAVPLPLDTQAPAITLTTPNTTTLITSNALTVTLPIAGQVSDDRGLVTVLMAGRVITPALDGSIATNATIKRGLNVLSLTAVDAAGNITSTPGVMVYLLAPHGSVLSMNRTAAQLGDLLKYQIVLTTTGAYSNVVTSLPLPKTFLSNVTISASTGGAYIHYYDQAMHSAGWSGDVSAAQPVTITVQGTVATTGTLTATATIYWGLGFKDTQASSFTVSGSAARKVYLPLIRR